MFFLEGIFYSVFKEPNLIHKMLSKMCEIDQHMNVDYEFSLNSLNEFYCVFLKPINLWPLILVSEISDIFERFAEHT